MLLRDHTLYFGGWFTTIDGVERHHLAAVDIAGAQRPDDVGGDRRRPGSGRARPVGEPTVTAWDPRVEYNPYSPLFIWALVSDEKRIYVGGEFSYVSGQPRSCLAAVDPDSGAVQPWAPQIDLEYNYYYYEPRVRAMAIDKHRLYIGGRFSSVSGEPRNALAAVDLETGKAVHWNPTLVDVIPYAEVDVIASQSGNVYVGGAFRKVNGVTRDYAAAFDAASGALTDWNPRPNTLVYTLGVSERALYMGGPFTSIWDWQYRAGLAALDATTGKLLPWNANMSPLVISALAVSDSTLYVGGAFNAVGGKPRRNIAALDAQTGEVRDWNPGCNSTVGAFVVDGSTLYVGGNFGVMAGALRSGLAAFDIPTGALTSWNPGTDGPVSAMALSNGALYVGGEFRYVGGERRANLAAVDATSGALLPWNPVASYEVKSLVINDGSVYVAGMFNTLGGVPRNWLGAVDASTGSVTNWDPEPDGLVYALASVGPSVFAGGNFRSIGGRHVSYLAAVDAATGLATSWNPAADNVLWSMDTHAGMLYAGGSFRAVQGEPHSGIVGLHVDGLVTPVTRARGRAMPAAMLATISHDLGRSSAVIQYTLAARAPVTLAVYDLQGRKVSSLLDREIQLAGPHQQAIRTEGWRPGYYFCRLEANGAVAMRKLLVR
jgi:hypothetical protein